MRLQKYLNEKTYYVEDIDEIVKILKRDCQPYIDDVSRHYKKFFFSGRKDRTFFDKKRVRKDRKPRDTPVEIHNFVDDWFYKKFGIRYRSNAMFASFDNISVQTYGESYIVFPVGKYNAVSGNIIDLYSQIEEDSFEYLMGMELNYQGKNLSDEQRDGILDITRRILNNANYRDVKNNIGMPEIMVNCKEYYILYYNTIVREIGESMLLQKLI